MLRSFINDYKATGAPHHFRKAQNVGAQNGQQVQLNLSYSQILVSININVIWGYPALSSNVLIYFLLFDSRLVAILFLLLSSPPPPHGSVGIIRHPSNERDKEKHDSDDRSPRQLFPFHDSITLMNGRRRRHRESAAVNKHVSHPPAQSRSICQPLRQCASKTRQIRLVRLTHQRRRRLARLPTDRPQQEQQTKKQDSRQSETIDRRPVTQSDSHDGFALSLSLSQSKGGAPCLALAFQIHRRQTDKTARHL